MNEPKIDSNIDFHRLEGDRICQYVNLSKYDSGQENWHSLEEIFETQDFLDLLFIKLTGFAPTENHKRLLLKTFLITSYGTGCHPPSVMVPKLVSSTTKNREFAIITGLVAGLATFGTDHLGAVVGMMKTGRELCDKINNENINLVISDYVDEQLKRSCKIKGFGHPVYKEDPRPDLLESEVELNFPESKFLNIYRHLKDIIYERKKIHPNIDSVLALSYNVLGFEPEHGIYLSFLSRSLSMVSHILEEQPKKPFSFLNEIVTLEDFSK